MPSRRWPYFALGIAAVLAAAPAAEPAAAESTWEFSPYRVTLLVDDRPVAGLGPAHVERLQTVLAARCRANLGAPWQTTLVRGSGSLRPHDVLADQPAESAAVALAGEADKLIWVIVEPLVDGWEVAAREFDVRTRRFGTIRRRRVAQSEQLADEAFRLACEAFAPLVEIESTAQRSATVRLRAGALDFRDPALEMLPPGSILLPVVRYTDRGGAARRIVPVEWTYLSVQSRDGALATCRVDSGLRSPLAQRRRGRVEVLAVLVAPGDGPTRLRLESSTEPHQPLAGYDLYAYGPESRQTIPLGRSDRRGEIVVEPAANPLRLILVTHGGEPVARFPLLVGAEPVRAIQLMNDDPRLIWEGFLFGLQERLIDTVARREALMALARTRAAEGKWEEVDEALDALRRLPARQQLLRQLQQAERRAAADDPRTKRRVEKLFGDTRQVLEAALDPQAVDDLEAELRSAQQAAG